ncbi:hypothetical protein T4A_9139 [Trichinella pseudospiralis]|uniref:Uncharacterized protein n=1 Tax=Trichinella pseudospiralis TaxID=6337 RepID=A0A0V1EG59_TRIPS|nr:hypothetical protein T4A_9139 [Trichinella pseudospiralis]
MLTQRRRHKPTQMTSQAKLASSKTTGVTVYYYDASNVPHEKFFAKINFMLHNFGGNYPHSQENHFLRISAHHPPPTTFWALYHKSETYESNLITMIVTNVYSTALLLMENEVILPDSKYVLFGSFPFYQSSTYVVCYNSALQYYP